MFGARATHICWQVWCFLDLTTVIRFYVAPKSKSKSKNKSKSKSNGKSKSKSNGKSKSKSNGISNTIISTITVYAVYQVYAVRSEL